MTNAEKVAIVKRHTEENIPLSDLAGQYGINPDQIYIWKRQLAEAAISRLLLQAELVTREQIRRGITYQRAHGGRTVEALIELGFLKAETFVHFVARQQGIPSLNLRNYKIDPDIANLVSADFAKERLVLPVDRLGRLLTVAMACPLDEDTIRDINKLTGLKTRPLLANKADIMGAIRTVFRGDTKPENPSGIPWAVPADSASVELCPVPEPDIVNLIRQVAVLPLTPGSIHLLRHAMERGGVNEEELARVMMMDPLMTARLLTLANVEIYGQSGRICSLRKAIELLGTEKTCAMVGTADTVFPYSHWDHFHFQSIWTDAVCCAKAAAFLALHCDMGRQDDFHTAGLLHDLGRIVLFEILPQHYAQTDSEATGVTLLIQEKERVGMPHTVAGYELAKHWHLPEEFAETIRSHHFPEQARTCSDFAAVVSVGNVMADCVRRSADMDPETMEICKPAMRMLGLKEAELRTLHKEYANLIPSLFLENVAV